MDVNFLRIEELEVGYDEKRILEKICLELRQGEILTLIGPNGAGKSTILKTIAGLLKPVHGKVYLGRESVFELRPEELSRKMSVLFTEMLRAENMSCREVVATGRYPYTGRFGILSSNDKDVIENAMELVKVTELGEADFRKISDGQRQRVMLARAIAQEPDLILLDEPTSYLDIRYKLEFLSVLKDLREQKQLTVVMSLHELDMAELISDRLLCIRDGRVDRFGSKEEIFQKGYIKSLYGISDELEAFANTGGKTAIFL